MSQSDLIALLLYASAMSFTPGPNTALAASLAAGGGLRAALPFVASVPVGWTILLLSSTGIVSLVALAPLMSDALLVLASAYMFWLAWLLSKRAHLATSSEQFGGVGFLRGVILQFANGKAWLNTLTVSATWVVSEGETARRLLQVAPVMAVFSVSSNFVYAVVGAQLRGWLSVGKRLLWFNRTLAAVLAGTAIWLLSTIGRR